MASPTPARPRTPGRSPPPDALPPVVENGSSIPSSPPPPVQQPNNNNNNARRTSLGFLRRAKSTEPLGDRKQPAKMSKRQLKEQAKEEELRRKREAAAVPKVPPKLPDFSPTPQLNTFGGEEGRPDSLAIVSNRAGNHHSQAPPERGSTALSAPGGAPRAKSVEYVDPYARTESMTHRGRYSYASSAVSTINSPRRVRRRKDPTPYNVLVIGARNSGKTSFLNFLRTSLALPPSKRPTRSPEELEDLPQTSSVNSNFTCHYLETEIDHERVGLTLWDSQGLERNMVDLQLREITSFLESKFDDTFAEEMKVIRAPGVRDTHIHCVFLVLDPARLDNNIAAAQKGENEKPAKDDPVGVVGGLDEELDLQVLRIMLGKTTVVPIISKADTITTAHMAYLKKTVWDGLKKAGIDPLEVLTLEGQEEESSTGSLDKFDEKEEDDMLENESDEEGEEHPEAEEERKEGEDPAAGRRTPESETVPGSSTAPPPSSSPRGATGHSKRLSISSIAVSNGESPLIPLSILSPDPHSLNSKDEPVGRKFPWGFADPYNPEHCDFLKLKESVFGEWRGELREASREVWYERWRTSRLNYGSLPTLPRDDPRNGIRSTSSRSGRATR